MRKFLTILFLICFYHSFAQPITNRSNATVTVQDSRYSAFYNLFIPKYADTTTANTWKGIDSCGAIIYTYDINGLWYRQCSPKKWINYATPSGGGGGGSQTWQQTLTTGSTLTGNNTIAGGGYKFLWNALDSLHLRGSNISTDPTVLALDEALFLYRQPNDAQSRIFSAQNFTLNLAGGVSTNGITLSPNSFNASGGNIRFSNHDLDYVDQSFISGGASEIGRIGIDANRRFYLKGMYDSTSISFRSTGSASVYVDSSRFAQAYGTSTASANSLTLPFNGNSFPITGTTQLNAITTYAWQAGSIINLKFADAVTVKNLTAGGAGTAQIRLSGGQDFTTSAGDILSLFYDGSSWFEIGRSYANQVTGALFARSGDQRNQTASAMSFSAASQNFTIDSVRYMFIESYHTSGGFAAEHNTDSTYTPMWVENGNAGHLLTYNHFSAGNKQAGITMTKTMSNTSYPLLRIYGDGGVEMPDLALGSTTDSVLVYNPSTDRVGYKSLTAIGTTYTSSELVTLNGSNFEFGGTATVDRTATLGANTVLFTANSLAGDPAISITSNSTAAASDLQKGVNIALSGANSNSGQDTYGVYSVNSHTGTTSKNYGGFFSAVSGASANYGVYAEGDGAVGIAVYGSNIGTADGWGGLFVTSSGLGVEGQAAAGIGVYGHASGANGVGVRASGDLSTAGSVKAFYATSTTAGTATTHIAGQFEASNATNNYAIIVPSGLGNVGIGTSTPSTKALLELSSTTQGFIPSRMTAVQRAAISSPGAANLVWDTDSLRYMGYDGSAWKGIAWTGEGGSGSTTWNGITNPTGDQALTFDAGESSTWTNSNTTEDLFTVNSSTITTSSFFSLNSTSTALAAGNNLMELVMSGANGTNAITATGLRISVTNTNATSGTNVALDVTASGATTANRSIIATGTALFVTAGNSEHYLMANDATPTTGENNVKLWYSSNFVIMDANHGAGGSFTLRNNGAGPIQLTAASSQEVQLRPNSTTTATFSGTSLILTTSTSIGTSSAPTARLHIATGTASASTAPIKITTTSAALMTAAEAGAIEVLVDSLYYTGSGATRNKIAYASAIGSQSLKQGASVASVAGAITLGQDGNVFEITGTNAITLINNVRWQNGSMVTLLFTSTASLTDGTANSGNDIGMELAGNANFTGSAGATLTLVLSSVSGTVRWRETSRSVN
jgi:hypothetical protein